MDLDTTSRTTLWKDITMVEINVAVLHSFQVRVLKKDKENSDFISLKIYGSVTDDCHLRGSSDSPLQVPAAIIGNDDDDDDDLVVEKKQTQKYDSAQI